MSAFVELHLRRNRGWPWPEDSWGLSPMFGDDGWCHSCGTPVRPQSGSLVLQRKGLARPEGAWVPNWRYDVICLEGELARRVATTFRVELLPVSWKGTSPGDAMQIVVPTVGDAWFAPDAVREAAVAAHGRDGERCAECGIWRWMPLDLEELPTPSPAVLACEDNDVIASPEWFGAGYKSFRQVLVRRELAELLTAASPRDFKVRQFG